MCGNRRKNIMKPLYFRFENDVTQCQIIKINFKRNRCYKKEVREMCLMHRRICFEDHVVGGRKILKLERKTD